MTLTTKLTAAMVFLALSTAGVVGMLTYRNLEKAILPAELARLQAHVQRQGARLDEVISLARNDVIAFATGAAALEGIVRARLNGGIDPQDGTNEQAWRMRMARRFVADLQTKPGYAQFRIIGVADGGREIVRVDRFGPNGAVRIVPDDELQVKGNWDYFMETLKLPAGAVNLSTIDLHRERGKLVVPHQPTIRAATPIYTPAGEPFGIVIINVDLSQTLARASKTEHPGGRVYVVNADGYYLLHPQSEKAFAFELGRDDRVQAEYPELAAYLGKTEAKVGVMLSPGGESLGVAMLPLRLGGSSWIALVEAVPEAELLAPLVLVRHSSLVAGGVVALLAVGLAVWLSRSLTNPLILLKRTVESFSSGEARPVRVAASGEIGVLSRAFERMQHEVSTKTEALRRSEHRFRALLEHSADGLALIDANNKILYLSSSVSVIEGYSPEELIGRNGTENTHPDDLPLVTEAVQKLVAGPGKPIRVLWRRRHKDGRWLWLEGVATNLLNDPAVGAIVTNYRDVTERIRAEAALRESEELFSKAFLLSPDCVAIVRLADRTVVKANEALCLLWGSTPADVIGKPTREYTTWLNESEQLAFMRVLQDKGEYLDYETKLRLKDGRIVELNVSSRLITLDGEACVLSVMRDITERKRAEVAAGQLAAIVEYSDDAIIGKDLSGIVTSWNAGAEKTFGYPAREMVGQSISRLIPPERIQEETDIIDRLRRGERIQHFDTVRLRKDGSAADVSVTISAIKGPAGQIVGASKVARDITGRKAAEAAVQASEARYRTLFEYAPDGIVIADPQSYYLDANTSLCRMLGYTRDEFIGLHASDIVAQTEVEHIGTALGVLKAKSDYRREWQFRRKDGSTFPADVIATMMPDGNLLAVIRDITERRRTEQAIRESEAHFHFLNDLGEATRTLADSNQIMEVMARMLGEHLRVSRCAYADVEKDGEQFTILHDYTDGCVSTVGKYQLSLFGSRAVTTLHNGQTLIIRNVETELRPDEGADMFNAIGIQAIITCPLVKDGSLRAMMAVHQTTPRDWKAGEIAIVQDVVERCWSTIERRTAEEKIRQLNVELEQRVSERTGQLEAANKELEAFSYSVSHDLRAPLRAVDGFSQAVLEDFGPQLPVEGQRYLQAIRSGAQQMGMLIDDLLAFARLSRQELKKRTIDTDQLVRGTLAELGVPLPGRQVEIRVGALPASLGDPALLKQVWINLLSNALKYTRRREQAIVEIGCVPGKAVNTYFIRDNGTGFDMQYAHKLFGVFQRLHRAEDYEGTGVGLAIVQRVIHRHGGRVWAEAAVDRGATFYFTLEGEAKS